jgi:hypothetical protein
MLGRTRTARLGLFTAAGALALSLAFVPAAFAGKGGGKPSGGSGGSGSYTVSLSTPGPYTFGESVYTTTNAPQVSQSYIGMSCVQNGVLVLTGSHANWSGGWYYNWVWVLGPSQVWTGGAADCTLKVFHISNNKQITDATSSFHVDG